MPIVLIKCKNSLNTESYIYAYSITSFEKEKNTTTLICGEDRYTIEIELLELLKLIYSEGVTIIDEDKIIEEQFNQIEAQINGI